MESLGPYKILLVENDPAAADLTKSILSDWGLTVFIAKDGNEAIELTRASTYDLILIDIHVPGLDGYETAHIIQQLGDQFKNVPIIGYATLADVNTKEAQGQVFTDLIVKPLDPAKLYSTLKKYLGSDEPSNLKANLDRCTEGDIEFRRELAQLLANNISELMTNIEKALQHKDPTIFGRAVHKTKTTLSILGDTELTEKLNVIQAEIGQGISVTELERHVETLNNKCQKTINLLNALSEQ